MENLLEVNIPEEVEQQLQRLDREEEEQQWWEQEQDREQEPEPQGSNHEGPSR